MQLGKHRVTVADAGIHEEHVRFDHGEAVSNCVRIVVQHIAVLDLHRAAQNMDRILHGPVVLHLRSNNLQACKDVLILFLRKLDKDRLSLDPVIDFVGHRVDKAAVACLVSCQLTLSNSHDG